jgi:hypothetical protein
MLVHSYWQGVLAEAKDWNEVRMLAMAPSPPPLSETDLAGGIEVAAEELDRRQSSGVRILWKNLPLATLPYQPCAEAVGSRHLYAWLEQSGALLVRRAGALYAALGIEGDVDLGSLAHTPPQRVRTPPPDSVMPAMVTEVDLCEGVSTLRPLLAAVSQRALVRQGALVHGWLHLEAQATPRTVGEVLYAMLAQLDDTLLLASAGAAHHKRTPVTP